MAPQGSPELAYRRAILDKAIRRLELHRLPEDCPSRAPSADVSSRRPATALLQFPSIVAAVECAILMQKMMAERNAALPEAKRILYRIGVNLGDVLIEGDERVLERAVEPADGGADGLHMTISCSAEPGMESLLDLRVKQQFVG